MDIFQVQIIYNLFLFIVGVMSCCCGFRLDNYRLNVVVDGEAFYGRITLMGG
jgi:hypothetical protein